MKSIFSLLILFSSVYSFSQSVYIPQTPTIYLSEASIPCDYNVPSGIRSIEWTKTEGPGGVVLLTPFDSTLKVARLQSGEYRFDIKVIDSNYNVYYDYVRTLVEGVSATVVDTVYQYVKDTIYINTRDTITIERNSMYSDSALKIWPLTDGAYIIEFNIGGAKVRFVREFVWIKEELIGDAWIRKY